MTSINFKLSFFVFLFTSIFICSDSFAQLEQGAFVINERFDFSTTTTKSDNFPEEKITTYYSTTSFGYLIKENQEIGISLLIGGEKYSSDGNNARNRYGFGIYYKRYIPIIDKLSFFLTPQLSYSNSSIDSPVEISRNDIGANIYTGLLYCPTNRFGLSMNLVGAGINYESYKRPDLKQNSFSLSNIGGLNLALQFMF